MFAQLGLGRTGLGHVVRGFAQNQATARAELCLPCLGGETHLSQLTTVPSLYHSYPVVALFCRKDGACVVSWHGWSGVNCCQVAAIRNLGCCLSKYQLWLPQPYPGSIPGPGHLCVLKSSLFPGTGCPRSSVVLWCAVSRTRAFTWLGLQHSMRWSWEIWLLLGQTPLCPASGARQCTHAPC